MDEDLRIAYERHDGVQELIDCLRFTLEGISLSFDRWDEQYVTGPGMYVAVVTGPSVADFADPMGENEWPVERCRDVCLDLQTFYETARHVALTQDGGLVVSVDGVVQRQMVRFRDLVPGETDDLAPQRDDYADWMGSRHMSALDTSRRPNVVTTLTLSEETGRVSAFDDGELETNERSELGGPWNADGRS
ncbi:diadenylate cyclase [Halopiger goleimassiliensis]|uniref:diadenylate cyclase n=1 Tax=Halopiger goleimassiliensis TaxID=1293048 RepID=UPI000677DA76|nr:diadenylate cyclase [Halopiger goleimassiliensis]